MNSTNRIQRKFHILFNETTNSIRTVPNFIVTGTSFCAKTLLYNNLAQHKFILNNLREESGYFLDTFEKGIEWYKSNFPSKLYQKFFQIYHGAKPLVGETVNLPGYFVPKRVHDTLQDPKIIVILRNPVDRAYARYLEEIRNGNETKSFEDALKIELDSIGNSEEEIINTKSPLELRHLFLYRLEGLYVEYLKQWNKFFPIKDLHIVNADDLFSKSLETINNCYNFLNLDSVERLQLHGKNYEDKEPVLDDKIRQNLLEYFEPYNQKLYQFLNIDFGWK